MWEVEYTDTFGSWWDRLTPDEQERVTAAVELLEEGGPALGRPLVDTLKGSRHPNMKELRPHGGHMRVLFAFDPRRMAILLMGGDKSRRWSSWYAEAIPAADQLYDEHLKTLRDEGAIPMTPTKTTKHRKGFDELRKQIDADPARRGRVEEHKAAMLGDLRRELDLTQVIVAERLDVTQENISQIERGEADVRLSTLSRYVEALGGRLEVRAAFPEQTVALDVGEAATTRRRRARLKTSGGTSASRRSRSPSAKGSRKPKATGREGDLRKRPGRDAPT